MAQHDMNIANQGFPATRADINNALNAIATNNSGTSEPSTTFANQWFYNTNTNKLFIRNEANNAFIEVATLDQTNNEWQITTGTIQAKDSDGLALKTDDGNTRIFINDSDGNVGIGTTDVNGGRLVVGDAVSGDTSLIQLLRTGVTERTNFIGLSDSDALVISADENNEGADSNIRFKVDGSEVMQINANGLDLGTTTDAASVSTTSSDYQLQLGAAQSTTGDIGRNISFDLSGTTTAAINSVDDGTSNAQALAFFTGNSSGISEALRINKDQKVGIGTTSPSALVHLKHDASGEDCELRIENDNASSGADAVLNIQANGNNFSIINFPDADTSNANRTSFKSTAGSSYFTFDPDGQTGIMTLTGSNIGFGTTDPDSFVPSNVSGGRDIVNKGSGGATYIAARDDNSISAGNVIGAYLFRSNDASGVKFGGMRGTADDSTGNFHIDFFRGNAGTDSAGTEPTLRISDIGALWQKESNYYLGRTDDGTYNGTEVFFGAYHASDTYALMRVRNGTAGDYVFIYQRQGTLKAEIEENGDFLSATNSYGSTSDERLKENIEASGSQWDDVKALQIKKYSMKEDNLDAPNMLGVIAQDLQASGMNGLVKSHTIKDDQDNPILDDDGNEQNFLSVKYSVLYMKAVKALQEAMTKIETLEAQNTTQATQIADLITRVEALEGA